MKIGSTDNAIKGLPYGISDYALIRRENYYYVDKTRFLEEIRKAGRYLFLLRPRRFGKSLFLSLMEAYHDIYYGDRFDEFFKGTWIYDQPTELQGKYLMLRFNFSMVDPSMESIEGSFVNHVRGRSMSFLEKYADRFKKQVTYFRDKISDSGSGADILSMLSELCKINGQQLYVVIDEYDNFSNIILSTLGEREYRKLTHGGGFFRSFFSVLKGGVDQTDAPFSRLFITGVSPVTLDDLTSGFNIGMNISLEPAFNRMLGFTEQDVKDMLDYYDKAGKLADDPGQLFGIMKEWYGNYRFSEDDGATLFNSDMVLYFLENYFSRGKIPVDLIDRNVRVDYSKLKHLIIIDSKKGKSLNGNFGRLREIVESGQISSDISKGFPLEELVENKNFISLLYYFGLLGIDGVERGKPRLKIPNETIKRLYYDYINEGYRETDVFSLDLGRYSALMGEMAYDGKWEPFFRFIAEEMENSIRLRDLITGEKAVHAFLNVYLGLSNFYIIHRERELNKGYADIFMEPFSAGYEGIGYSYLLETKYLKATDKPDAAKTDKLRDEAAEQLQGYSKDSHLKKSIGGTQLIKLALVFCGHRLELIEAVD